MAEQPIFWRGGAPGKSRLEEPQPPAATHFEPALRDACAGCGYEMKEYFAAQGAYGGWLAHLERAGERYRIFWSGKSKQLTFEQARPSGWDERAGVLHEDTGLPGFVAGVKALLGASDADRGGASSA
jgi:hypothetical protein